MAVETAPVQTTLLFTTAYVLDMAELCVGTIIDTPPLPMAINIINPSPE